MKNEELFSAQADSYAKYRPVYPPELYEFILRHVPERDVAWDCGTGNGQAASVLATYFKKVYATDISDRQLSLAIRKDNIEYIECHAGHTPFPENSFDLVTVAQAYHWFDFGLFRAEVTRVSKSGTVLALWSYGRVRIEPLIDDLLKNFHDEILRTFWDDRRKYVIDELRTVPFDFPEIPAPPFTIKLEWKITELAGYLDSWSAVEICKRKTGINPVPECIEKISSIWNYNESKIVNFPLSLRLGKIVK